MPPISTRQLITRIFNLCYPKNAPKIRRSVWLALSLLILGKGSLSMAPLVFKEGLNVLSQNSETYFYPLFLMLMYGFLYFIGGSLTALKDVIFTNAEISAVTTLAHKLFRHLHQLSYDFHIRRKTGRITTIFEKGISSLERFLRFFIFSTLPMLFEVCLVFCLLISLYDFFYAGVIFVTLFIYILYTLKVANWRTQQVREMNKYHAEANAYALDSLINFETIRIFGREHLDQQIYAQKFSQAQKWRRKTLISLGYLNIGQSFIMGVGLMCLLFMGFQDVKSGLFGVGDVVLLNMYLIQLYGPLSNLGFSYREMKMALTHIEQAEEILAEPATVVDFRRAQDLVPKEGSIRFDTLSFDYPGRKNIIQSVSFTVPAKKTVAIVGQSGSGKSTLTRLLLRFYDPTEGAITIDDQDIQKVTQASLRSVIGVVPQDIVLFNTSIYDNIAFARPTASSEDVEQAAKKALIHDFIMGLPKGYQTIVGERGLKLSGGEKQRVAIARLILKQPKIFVFDEATSSLDTRTEKEIHANIASISKGYTTLIIAHRLSTVSDADQILFMEKGQIVERGTHAELLAKKGHYYRLWQAQKKEKKGGSQ
jgi:ATP-binding cassette subfamily B protein